VGKGGGRPRIAALAMGIFIEKLGEGATQEEAARAAGHSRAAFYRLRRRDGEFAAMWAEAIARSSAKRFVHGGRRRTLQLRRVRSIRFTAERRQIFLDHFAGTANTAEAAAKAGICEGTVDAHRRKDPVFARRFLEALAHAVVKLEADVTARRLAEQKRLRDIEPTGAPEPEFERAMKLLRRWDRQGAAAPDSRIVGEGARKRWSFEDSLALLEKKLRNMGIPIEPLPPGHERPDGDQPLLPPPSPSSDGESGEDKDKGECREDEE
jgi:hypothetical protein